MKKVKKKESHKPHRPKVKHTKAEPPTIKDSTQDIDSYDFTSGNVPIRVRIYKKPGEYVPIYDISIAEISRTTEIILERVRKELVKVVSFEMVDITDPNKSRKIEDRFKDTIHILIKKYFPDIDERTSEHLISYLIQRSLGMGTVENLIADQNLEEITINNASEPIWVYHRKHGWLKTNISMENEDQIRHYSSMIARKVGRQISISFPLLDANIAGGRLNATLNPITIKGNTITIRKFATKPWTITDFIRTNSISSAGAALIWTAVQYELSTLISGGTASGKTSMLNVVANFFPPNQRIISIEDTQEIVLPRYLHWVPMITRLPNPEGKGEISMLDLLVNSLRMRPDRIIVGEIRRKKEAEVLFEAIHTGHSVYATVHANNTQETITRLTNPPIDIPPMMLPAISLIVVQYRNRRTGLRRTYQISEITENGNAMVLMQYDPKKDTLKMITESVTLMNTLEEFTGMAREKIINDMNEKERILNWMVRHDISSVDSVGKVMAEYYIHKVHLMEFVRKNLPLG